MKPKKELSNEQIAEVCHEANRAFARILGDDEAGLPHWKFAPSWQKESAVAGVEYRRMHPKATPRDLHNQWCDKKLKDGWTYGPEKNAALKTHPCILNYDSLDLNQKRKDYLFGAIVASLTVKEA